MKRSRRSTRASVVLAGMMVTSPAVRAAQVAIPASKDNTLYGYTAGTTSNGAGQHFFAGFTGPFDGTIRRGLVAFDVAAYVPAGATIDAVTLTLNMSMTSVSAGNQTINLHRVLADWGEGTSDPLGNEGAGATATPGDATWQHTFFDTQFWATDGGDFSSTISAGRTVGDVGFYTWGSTAEMRADVQSWLDEPGTNFGWLLRGNEATLSTAKRFDSRENPILANQPVLVVDYTAAPRPGDYDGDGDVDLDDYGRFSGCVLGPDQGLGPGCAPGDFDSDSDVDLRDCADFQSAFGDP